MGGGRWQPAEARHMFATAGRSAEGMTVGDIEESQLKLVACAAKTKKKKKKTSKTKNFYLHSA